MSRLRIVLPLLCMLVATYLGATVGEQEAARRTQCGGAVLFAPGVLALACDFCGSDLYRAAIARVARRRAAAEEHEAGRSVHEALVSL